MKLLFDLRYPELRYTVFMYLASLLFVASTVLLFLYLNYIQPYYFIDEAFHIPQTLRYCAWNFTQWNPKITTLPGLYFIVTVILSPFNLCNIVYLRSINLIGTCLNVYLSYCIIQKSSESNPTNARWSTWSILALAYNIALFPPLYFWCFFYYTDVTSVNAVLLMLLLYKCECRWMTAFAGSMAIFIRQTNVVWLGFLTVERALDTFQRRMKQPVSTKLNTSWHFHLIWKQITYEWRNGPLSFFKFILLMCGDLLPYVMVCLLFVIFVIYNEGIVIGDRTAHVATIHICQIFYFSIFVFLFSWPYAMIHWLIYLRFLHRNWIFVSCIVVSMAVVIRFNTLVHPYVLADNRHYWFYVWNRLMGRYALFKYLLIPAYCTSLFAILRNIGHLRFLTRINYIVCVCMVLVPQLLVEPRYFILPYVFYRLSMERPHKWQVYLESLTTLAINFLQFFIFANKVFYWDNQPYPQRISW